MLLFLPGLICDARVFAPQLVAYPDSQVAPTYGLADSLAEMARIALAAAPDTFDLFGHSMGARVALEVVRVAPERVRRLALCSTGIHLPRAGEAESRRALQDIGRARGFAALVDTWLPPMVAEANRGEAYYDDLREMALSAGQARFDAQVTALLGRAEVATLLPAITCSVLVMTGALDLWSPPAQHEAIADAIPGAELVVIPGAGHMLPREAPGAVNRAISRWRETPSPPAMPVDARG